MIGEANLTALPAPPTIPTGVPLSRFDRMSYIYPAPTLDADSRPVGWTYTSLVREQWAKFIQLVIHDDDYTFARGFPVEIQRITEELPGGYGMMTFRLPGFTIYDGLVDNLEIAYGTPCEAYKILPDGTRGAKLFDGSITGPTEADGGMGRTFDCQGIFHADLAHTDDVDLNEVDLRDLGEVIADVLDNNPGRRMGLTIRDTVGVNDRSRGSTGQSRYDRITDLLAKSTSSDGLSDWTIVLQGKRPKLLKLSDIQAMTPDVSFRSGQPGIVVDVNKDLTGAPNVIFGTGVNPDGCRWYNMKAPKPLPDDGTAWCGTTITVGTTDGGTSSGTGVTDFQTRMQNLGFDVDITGTYTSDDADETSELQFAVGLTDDGVVNHATWDAAFATFVDTDEDVPRVVRRPLAYQGWVEPYLWGGHGLKIGANPGYNPDVLRVELDIDFGEHIHKRKARRLAHAMILRDWPAQWAGEVVFNADPEEMSRFDIHAGMICAARSLHSAEQNFVITGVDKDFDARAVTCQIVQHGYGLMSYDAIRNRNVAARQNPAKKFLRQLGKKTAQRPEYVPWLCEDGAGLIPKGTILTAGWNVVRFLGGEYGTVAETVLTTVSSAQEFAAAVFGKKVSPDDLDRMVWNPLTQHTPFDPNADDLDDAGMLAAWGQKDQPCGYYPHEKSNIDGTSYPLTGRFRDDAGFTFASNHVPWLWLAVWVGGGCTLSGRFRIAADE